MSIYFQNTAHVLVQTHFFLPILTYLKEIKMLFSPFFPFFPLGDWSVTPGKVQLQCCLCACRGHPGPELPPDQEQLVSVQLGRGAISLSEPRHPCGVAQEALG